MILKSCLNCKFHEIRKAEDEERSRCLRENCYSEFSKCIAERALHQFLEGDRAGIDRPFSVLERIYTQEQ